MLKVTEEKWREAMKNLNDRRKDVGHTNDNYRTASPVADYKAHLDRCFVGETVMDVGCGGQYLKRCLPEHCTYFGMDAFPIVANTIELAIDSPDFKAPGIYSTVCCFATLDGVRDFNLACQNMQSMAAVNIIILTGIGIDPDQYHTHRLELSDFDQAFEGWDFQRIQLSPVHYLMEYRRP